ARPLDDDLAAQRGEPGDRLHVDRERLDPRRHCRERHAAGRRDQRRLLDPRRADRDRHLPVPHPRALRDGRHPSAARASRGAALSALALVRGDPGALVVAAILVIPALGALVLAVLKDERKAAWLNLFVSFLTFLC